MTIFNIPVEIPPSNAKSRAELTADQKAKRLQNWLRRRFVAWDGEGLTREDGAHDYVILANSEGDEIVTDDFAVGGLSTREILRFVHSRAKTDDINIIYGAGYDWNCWLKDLDREELELLYETGQLAWRGFFIKWRPGKEFSVKRNGKRVVFYDVISFFQTSFLKACDQYLGAYEGRRTIEINKMKRSNFADTDMEEIRHYNKLELKLLVALMENLRERLAGADLIISRWDGPGAIASSLMRKKGVKKHLAQSPPEITLAARHAYFGGRFEVFRFGTFKGKTYEYDINSAYPRALLELPSLAHGEWVRFDVKSVGKYSSKFALFKVEYTADSKNTSLPHPLPQRLKNQNVIYPSHVIGWYWAPEFQAAKAWVKNYGGKIKFLDGYYFKPSTNEKPFAFVAEEYTKRQELRAKGDGAHIAIKLALNSLYGKLCQQIGWRIEKGELKIPPYHQIEYAGYITSYTRAMLLNASIGKAEQIIAYETDAVFTASPLNLQIGEGLGEWKPAELHDLIYVQSGVHFAHDKEGKSLPTKTRGFDKGSLDEKAIIAAWKKKKESYPILITRFIGLGLALAQDFEKWRRWITSEKNITLEPTGKRNAIPGLKKETLITHSWRTLPHRPDYTESQPHEIEWEGGETMAEIRRKWPEEIGVED